MDRFEDDLQQALQHLYDPAKLSSSPLISMFGLDFVQRPALALRDLLTERIESLRPDADIPTHTNEWRFYHLLSQRYIEQFRPDDVATFLSVGPRQLRRLHRQALYILAKLMWSEQEGSSHTEERAVAKQQGDMLATGSQRHEMDWLAMLPREATDPIALLEGALAIVGPLMRSLGVRLERSEVGKLSSLAVNLPAARHALLGVLSVAVHQAHGGRLQLCIEQMSSYVQIQITAMPPERDSFVTRQREPAGCTRTR